MYFTIVVKSGGNCYGRLQGFITQHHTHLITFKSNRSNLEESKIQINGSNIIESKNVKLLGVTLDHQLRLEEHIKVFCKEAGEKVNALARITSYMDESKRIL